MPGFVSEWLLVQSLIHAAPGHDTVVALTAPLAVGAVALTTGLGVAAMVKAFGIGFLARPRSESAAGAARVAGQHGRRDDDLRAAACRGWSRSRQSLVAPALRRVLDALPAAQAVPFTDFGAVVRLPGLPGSIAPGVIAAALLVAVLAAVVLARWRSRAAPPPRCCRCGRAAPTI